MLKQKQRFVQLAAMACAVAATADGQAAENSNQNKSAQSINTSPKTRSMPRPITADKDYAHELLKGFVDLPDIPKYPAAGAIFLTGWKCPNDTFGQSVSITFGVMEQASQVKDWYNSSLQQYQWKVFKPSPDASSRGDMYTVDAGKGKYNVSMLIRGVPGKPYRTSVTINFKYCK